MSIITTCRLCMQENVIVTSFYLSENTNQCFIRLLLTCAPVQVEDYNLSNLVCQLCKQELYRFGKFIKLLEKSNMFLGDNKSQENDEEFERITVDDENKSSIFIKESMSELELNDTQISEFEIAMDKIKTEIEDQVEENFELTDLQKTGEMLLLPQTELMAPKKKLTRKETLEKKRAAERLRYQRIKNDPKKYFHQKDKKKQNYQRQKEEGHIKTVNQMTPIERAKARKRWRERSKLYYHRKVLRGTNRLRVNVGSPPLMDSQKKLNREEALEEKRIPERVRYQRTKNDLEKYFHQKEKDKERQKDEGRKTVNQMTPKEKSKARKSCKDSSRLRRQGLTHQDCKIDDGSDHQTRQQIKIKQEIS